jgi:hypothetical protein
MVEDPLAERLLSGDFRPGERVVAMRSGSEIVFAGADNAGTTAALPSGDTTSET